jgi:hypothetical protein
MKQIESKANDSLTKRQRIVDENLHWMVYDDILGFSQS